MYQEAFDFNGRPFTMAPFVKHFFQEGPVKDALDQINESISRDAGPAIVIGQHGTGKSLLLAVLNEEYQQRFKVISLSCGPMSERRDLLQAILFELKQPYHDLSEGELRLSLIDFIKPTENCPNGVLLLIDDAQALTTDLVDELKMITNFVREGVPRVRVVLCGTDRLEEVLTEPKLEAFNQRLSTRCFLGNLTREQTRGYIHDHVSRVGGDAGTMFEQATTDAIHEATCGCPRFVNQLAEQCMIYAATQGSLVIEPQMVDPAWAQAQGLPTATPDNASASNAETSDENWTVIEFGSLDDDETESFSEPEQVSTPSEDATEDVAVEDVADIDQACALSADCADESAVGIVPEFSEQTASDADDSWSDVGTADPFVAAESESESEEVRTSDPQAEADEADSYQPINPELFQSDEPQTESQSIPTEFRDLNQDQEATWAAAGLTADEPGNESFSEVATPADSDASAQPEDETSGFSATQAMAAAALPTIPAIAAAVSVANPFEEAFESEEPVAQEFSELVAEQNASSAQVTGSQLDHLPTSDQNPAGDTGIPVVTLTEEVQVAEEVPTGEEVQVAEEAQANEETQVPEHTDETQEPVVQANAESDASTVSTEEPEPEYTADELASVFGTMDTAEPKDTSEESAFASAESDPVEPESSSFENPSAEGEYHEHDTAQPTADIQQKADEILSSIQTPVATDAAVETEPSPPPVATESVVQEENVELSEAQRILSEILEQKNLLSDQVSLSDDSNALASNETEFPQSLPMPNSFSGEEVLSESFGNDESTKAPGPPTAEVSQTVDATPTPDATPVSIGRAERMDYERLFDQLRDTGNQT